MARTGGMNRVNLEAAPRGVKFADVRFGAPQPRRRRRAFPRSPPLSRRLGERARLTPPRARALHVRVEFKNLRRFLFVFVAAIPLAALFSAGAWLGAKLMEKPAPALNEEAAAVAKPLARGFFEAALASRFSGRHREALQRLEEARRANPSQPGLEYQFALTHLDLREYEAAETCALQSVRRGEEQCNAHALLAMSALAKAKAAGTPELARDAVLKNVQEARIADPLSPAPHYALAEFYRATGRPDLALEAYRRALDRVSKSDSILVSTVKAGRSGLRLSHKPSAPPLHPKSADGTAPPEQLIFAAADALLRGDKDSASSYLAQARERIPGPLYEALLKDPFFQDYLAPGEVSSQINPPPE